jgi:hypothetical protein
MNMAVQWLFGAGRQVNEFNPMAAGVLPVI